MARIAISYRRSDTQAMTGRIFDRLVDRYGDESVFMDIDKIPFGFDFRDQIREVLERSDIILVVMGPDWVARKDDGSNRLFEEADPVRFEMETALHMKKPLIPVLVNDAVIPKPAELPESIRQLVYFNAAEIDAGRDFRVHMERLMHAMDQILARMAPQSTDTGRGNSQGEARPAPREARAAPANARTVSPVDRPKVDQEPVVKRRREDNAPPAPPPASRRWPGFRDAAVGALAIGVVGVLIVVAFGPTGGSSGELTLAVCSALASGLVGMALYRRDRLLGFRAALTGAAAGLLASLMIIAVLGEATSLSTIAEKLVGLLPLIFIGGNGVAAAIGNVLAQWQAYRGQPAGLPFGILARGSLGAKPG